MSFVIHWFRRDLRLTDNTALHHAAKAGIVVPAYVLSHWKQSHGWTGPKRQHFLCGNLESLAKNLETIGSKLILRAGDAVAELEKLASETNAKAIYFNRDPDPFGKAVESKLQAMCQNLGIQCLGFKDTVMHEAPEVLTATGQPYRVYTPYSKNWLGLPKLAPLPRVASLGPAPTVPSLPVPTLDHWGLTLPADTALLASGERAARDRMKHFIESGILACYGENRNLPAGQHGSRLSQDLRFGLISIRELYQRCQDYAAAHPATAGSVLTYVKELAWREFYMAILHFYPEVFDHEFNPDWRGLEWPATATAFRTWTEGRTGFPIVDAGMRQLVTTGLMHNRVRMIVAMFLTKDLHCDWRQGEQFFHQHLIDAEIASNNGGWQWSAGTGADAAPYFRIQNPWTQTLRYDPDGAFIKQWLPELKDVPAARLCEAPKDGRPLVPGYPLPIVDHSEERDRCLALFARHKERHAK